MTSSNNLKKNNRNLFHQLFALCIGVLGLAMAHDCRADDASQDIILAQAEAFGLVADDIKQEIKTHFRGLKGYGKLVGVTNKVRGRAATVIRRLKREPNYSNLDRDLEKLMVLTVELDQGYEELIAHVRQVGDYQANSNALLVKAQIVKAREIANSMRLARGGGLLPLDSENPNVQVVQEYNPQVDLAPGNPSTIVQAPIPAEAVRPTEPLRLTAPLQSTAPSRATEPSDGSQEMHSVLEK